MSTIPGGCFVAPDSLRRMNQLHRQHAREAKMQQQQQQQQQQALQSTPLDPGSPTVSPRDPSPISGLAVPPADQAKANLLTHMLTTAPLKLSEFFGRSRSVSSPQPTPPATPPMSPTLSPRSPRADPLAIPRPAEAEDAKNLRSHAGSI